MNRERLIHTAEKILPFVDKFNMGMWKDVDPNCGTTCCAFGWEALSEVGRANGLTWSLYDTTPTYEGKEGIEAAALYYDIPLDVAAWLFLPDSYVENDEGAYETDEGKEISYPRFREVPEAEDPDVFYDVDGKIEPSMVAARIHTILAACDGFKETA